MLKFDNWLISIYQALVNTIQKPPVWWIEQCSFMIFISGILRQFLKPEMLVWTNYFAICLDILVCTIFLMYSKAPALLQELALNYSFRVLMLFICTYSIFIAWGKYSPSHFSAELIYNLTFVSVYYFACCKLPPPRDTRRKLILTT